MLVGPEPRRVAVIDIGSNSATLAVFAADDGGGLRALSQRSEPLRLLSHLDPAGSLSTRAADATILILRDFLRDAAALGVTTIHLVATSALRDASNREVLVERVRAELGLILHVIDGDAEGRYAALAAVHSVPLSDGFVIDLGGGSLQIAALAQRRVVRVASVPLGALRLALRYRGEDPPDAAMVNAMRREVRAQLATVSWFRAGKGALVGLGGTVRALAKIDRRARRWAIPHTHGYRLTADAVDTIWELVSRLPTQQRLGIPGLPAHRVDLIIPGALVVSWIMRTAGFDELATSPVGVREGIALAHAAGTACEPPTEASLRERGLCARFPCSRDALRGARARRSGALQLFDALAAAGPLPGALREPFAASAWLDALWESGRPVPTAIAALLTEPIAGFWQDELLQMADLLSPVARLQIAPETRERLRILLDLAAAAPLEPPIVGTVSVEVRVAGTVSPELHDRFERGFTRRLHARSAMVSARA